jgi:hypothetical protein
MTRWPFSFTAPLLHHYLGHDPDRDAPRDPSEPHLTGRLYDPWMKRQSKHGVRGVAD